MTYKLPDYIFLLAVTATIITIGNAVGTEFGIIESIPGVLILFGIIFVSVLTQMFVPQKLKTFPVIGWITLYGVLLTIPWSPTAAYVVEATTKVNLLVTATPVLAYAGISLGKDMASLKRVGWKIALIAVLVFAGTFLGSAVVADIVLRMQGII